MTPSTERRLHGAALVLCLPIAILGAILPVNEYLAADGALTGAVDCDGPMSVLLFAGPTLIFYASNAAGLFWTRERAPRWHIGMAIFCLIVSIAVLPNAVTAFAANERNKAEAACA